ncbi:mechanosensitive ion channel family protein [[Leptolyngbya] sp. PCC 7376]|uniref:mechanosensitive ion channel family protein n=1 Tax=[Leptolyngbya] sp. PCC 7376 TaxID=111781 RepID=UPI0002EB0BA8|nr:mechanosensitive ion channel family protein [[Leptolyngbya] sp. PCC 7376]
MAKFWRRFFLALCTCLLCWQMGTAIAQPKVEPLITPEVSEPETLRGAPVVLGDDELFRIEARIASFDQEFRAKVISERLLEFAKNEELDVDYLQVIDNEETQTSDVLVGTTLLATFADVDAVAAGKDRYDLAKEYQNIIRDKILEYRAAFSLRNILLGVAYTIIATIILLLSFLAINLSLPRVHRYLRSCQSTWIPALKVFGIELLSSKQVVDLTLEVFKIIRLTTWLTLIYIYGNLVLSFFPWTQGFARQLFGYARSAIFTVVKGSINYLPNLFFIAVIIFVTSYTLKIFRFFFQEIEKEKITIQGFYAEWAIPTYKLVQVLVLVFAAIVAFPYLPGAETPAFQGVSIFVGLLLSLGSSAAVANVVAGTIMTYTRAFRIGDRIQIGETKGDVLAKTLLVTRIQTLKNEMITIPNSAVLSSHIVNYSEANNDPETPPLILYTTITLGYDVPWRKVHKVLLDAVAVTPNTLLTPRPFILQTSLDDFYVSYEINAYTDKPKLMPDTYSHLHRNIQDKCNEADIEILSPHYRAARDGNQITIPADYLPEDYEPPSFRINNFPPQKNS